MRKLITLLAVGSAMFGANAADISKDNGTLITKSILPPVREEAKWVDVEGECLLVDDITTGFFLLDQGVMSYEVSVQTDENNPGMYRLVNPWQYWPMLPVVKMTGGTVTVDDNFYIEIDATDPEAVKIYPQDAGLDDGEGPSIISSLYGVYDELHMSEVMAIAMSGVLEDNVIRFETPASMLLIQNGIGYRTNPEGRFAIVLPGGELPVDYTFEVEKEEILMPDADLNYHFYVDAEDERIPEVRWAVTTSYPSSQVCDKVAQEGTLCQLGDDVVVSVADVDARMAYVVFVTVDQWGDYQDMHFFEVYPPANMTSWEYVGKATLTEDFFATYMKDVEVETFDVDIEEHKQAKGYYRFELPLDVWSYGSLFKSRDDYPSYIYVNITNPERPYIAESCLGITRDGKEFAISSHYCQRVAWLGLQMVENMKEGSGGIWKDNVLTFEPEPGIFVKDSEAGTWAYVNARTNPDCDVKEFLTNPNYDVPRFLPGSFRLDMNKALSGICDVNREDNGKAVFYNLQGMEVDNPANGLFIVRKNGKTEKKYVR